MTRYLIFVQNPHLHKNSILAARLGDDFLIFVQSPVVISADKFIRYPPPAEVPLGDFLAAFFPDAEIASHWGEALWVQGKQSEARALWARSLARSPDSKALRTTIERLTGTKMEEPAKATPPDEKPGEDPPEPEALPTTPTASASSGR